MAVDKVCLPIFTPSNLSNLCLLAGKTVRDLDVEVTLRCWNILKTDVRDVVHIGNKVDNTLKRCNNGRIAMLCTVFQNIYTALNLHHAILL